MDFEMQDTRKIFSVSQINEYIKMLIASDEILRRVYIRGEISNFKYHTTGHLYFRLKDEGSLIAAVMFRGNAQKLAFVPKDGMKVIIGGYISVYTSGGNYQLYAETMEPDGIGALYIAFEQLKEKLSKEGLFDASKKKPIPKRPATIGIITSPQGAALQDMINILGRRFPYAKIVLYPSLVQGASAAPNLIEGLKYFNKTKLCDVIIIGRGGGSLEDLWAFNDEGLAREVRKSEIPVISAVGHETDFTICDFAADMRAPTPSAAAELAVPDTLELKRQINNVLIRLENDMQNKIKFSREKTANLAKSRALTSPMNFIDDKRMHILNLSELLSLKANNILQKKRMAFTTDVAKLSALDPMAVLSRGYGAVFDENKTVIKSVKQVNIDQSIKIRLGDGEIDTKICDIKEIRKNGGKK